MLKENIQKYTPTGDADNLFLYWVKSRERISETYLRWSVTWVFKELKMRLCHRCSILYLDKVLEDKHLPYMYANTVGILQKCTVTPPHIWHIWYWRKFVPVLCQHSWKKFRNRFTMISHLGSMTFLFYVRNPYCFGVEELGRHRTWFHHIREFLKRLIGVLFYVVILRVHVRRTGFDAVFFQLTTT
jgi:hypothetical protein